MMTKTEIEQIKRWASQKIFVLVPVDVYYENCFATHKDNWYLYWHLRNDNSICIADDEWTKYGSEPYWGEPMTVEETQRLVELKAFW
jgi:hypothetical protein